MGIAELGNLAMWIFVLYFFVWKVLMLFLNQLRSWRQLMPPHLAIHAQDAVAGAESQSVSRRIPVEAVLGSQLSLAKQSSQTLQATPSPPSQSSNVHSDKGLGIEINLDTQWSTEVMRDLIDMGFEDTAANTAALREAEGNLNLAIRNLMAQERCHQPSNQHS